jgi:hypothetical protein
MDEDHFSAPNKNKIGVSGQILPVQPVSISKAVNKPSQKKLWLCVSAFDLTHVLGASNRINRINHGRCEPCHESKITHPAQTIVNDGLKSGH